MIKNLETVNKFARVGAVLNLAQSEYKADQITRDEYLEILISCQRDTRKIKDNSTVIANQIKIPFNF